MNKDEKSWRVKSGMLAMLLNTACIYLNTSWDLSKCMAGLWVHLMPCKLAIVQGRVVQRMDNAIHRINHYPADSVVCFVNTYPLDSDLSTG